MESFDNQINDMFNSDLPEMPDGYSWDENKDVIYSKMTSKEESKRRPFIWLLLRSLAIILITSISFYYFTKEIPASLHENDNITQNNNVPNRNQTLKEETLLNPTMGISNSINTKPTYNSSSPSKTEDRINNNTIKDPITPYKEINNSSTKDNHKNLNKITNQNNLSDIITKHQFPKNNINKSQNITDNNTYNQTQFILPILTIINQPLLNYEHKLQVKKPIKNTYYTDLYTKTNIPFKHYLTIGSGTLISGGNYSGVDNRNLYSKWQPGYHVTVGYTLNKNRIGLQLYYDHNFAVQLFEFESQDSVLIDQEGEVIVNDPYTGQSQHFTTTQTNTTTRNREYTSYNTFRSHSLGLSLNYKVLNKRKFSSNVGIGSRYSFNIQSSGYNILANNEIVKYSNQNPIHTTNRIDITGMIDLNYQINSKFDIRTYVRWNESLKNQSTENNVSLKDRQVLLGLGLSYSL